MAFSGGCLCGAIRYEIDRTHLNAMHCYCSMCRRAHGTAFSTHAMLRPDQLRWLAGEGTLSVYRSSTHGRREFCRHCGTHLLVHGQTADGALAVPVGTLDGDPPVTLRGHIFVADKVSWWQIADDLPQHAAWPPGVEATG